MHETRKIDWATQREAIESLRHTVFIEEQKVDRSDEFDGLDELSSTHHFSVFDKNENMIAYGRLIQGGKIGRMAVLPEHRNQGIGSKILKEICLFALKNKTLNDRNALYLHAQTHARSFYDRAGFKPEGEVFMEAGIEHISMHFDSTDPSAIEALLKDSVLRFSSTEDIHFHLEKITQCTSRYVDILSDHLQHPIFTEESFVNALSRAARRSRNSFIRILLRDSKNIHGRSHPLITLTQRLGSKIEIRSLTEEPGKPDIAYLISDSQRLVYFNNEEEHTGFANYRAGPEAETILEEFNNMWNKHSKPDPNLKRLNL